MEMKPNEQAVEYYKFQAQRYRFILFGSVAGLLFIYQNSVFGDTAVEIRPNFLISISLLFVALFCAYSGFEGINAQISKFLKDRTQSSDASYNMEGPEQAGKWLYRIAHQSFQFGIIGIFMEYFHFWLVRNADWYATFPGIFPLS